MPAADGPRPSDLLERDFSSPAPNTRWVADITYVDTFTGFAYTAFITDLHSRAIVGWQVADNLRADLALDALEMAIFAREDGIGSNLVHHSDRGVQYTSVHYTQRLEDIKAVRSVGSKGDCPLTGQSLEIRRSATRRELPGCLPGGDGGDTPVRHEHGGLPAAA